jgi:glycosyltransferase involved in cell wall biosynthesis
MKMSSLINKSKIWHCINNSDPKRGGAQRILQLLVIENVEVISLEHIIKIKVSNKIKLILVPFIFIYKALLSKPDVVVFHSRCFLPFVWLLSLMRIPTVFYCHANYRHGNYLFKIFRCNRYIAVSNAVNNFLVLFGIPESDITIIFNPYFGKSPIKEVRSDINTLLVDSIGSLQPWKGFKQVISLLVQFSEVSSKKILYRIVGSGPEYTSLKKIKDSNSLNSFKLDLIGYVADPFESLNNGRLFLIPSLEEGFGLVAIEAIYQGKVIVYSRIEALEEICANDPLSFGFDQNSYESFKVAMESAIKVISRNQFSKYNNDRREWVKKNFSIECFFQAQKKFNQTYFGVDIY